ncbi:TIM-barrel domain-containing protein [Gaetbulibacter sp. M235]|uniref:glycoside hydrolase family 31 protein n=1 Tax=Gaetbulibacter sp. M235 TaxID=3126510 RepID=UPI00374EFCDB
MNRYFYTIVGWFFISAIAFAQNPNRIFESFKEHSDSTFEIKVNDGSYSIQFYSSEIVETTFIPEGEVFNPKSHAVVLTPQSTETSVKDGENSIEISSKELSVIINKNPFQIAYSYKGEVVISEKGGYIKNDNLETIQFNLTKDEVIYGGGARALGMNRRGYKLPLYNRAHYGYETHSEQMNFAIPIVLSSKQYMVHFDNAPIGFLDLDSKGDNTLTYETISGRKTYQVIVGDSWYDLIGNYTDLTGKQPFPPRWTLGNFSSRFGYHSQNETEATIDKFKEDNIPVDAIILDLYWFGKDIKGTMGNLEVFKDSFPDFEGMVSRLKNKGVKTVLITEPFILTTSNRWQEAVDEDVLAKDSLGNPGTYDFYFGNTGLIDIYKPKAEQWFWNIYKGLADKGVSGFWGDLGEPEVHPSSLVHATGTADEVHNIYGHDWARLVYEGYQRDFKDQRPFILMRAGYSGSQRYGLIPWSGDVNRSWGGLQSQPEIALQMGMQGLAYMHSDLGGFAGANLDDELYVRWLQYGVFQPIYRPHAQEEVPSEPVFRSEKAKALAKEAIELRYKLLPYSYNLAFQNNQTGVPLMRPLFFEEPENQSLFSDSSTYLWGQDFLVSPILENHKEQQTVYFPKENIWFDFYTDEAIEGEQSKNVQTKENSIPTYIRGGAFVLMAKPMQNTEEYKADRLELHYYNDSSIKNSERKFYNDDGKTANAFEKGIYEMLIFKSKSEKKCLKLEFTAQTGKNYVSSDKQILVVIHNIQKAPKRVKINDRKVKFNWNSIDRTLTIPTVWNTDKDAKIILK